jgi:hypothetical protein
VKKSEMIDLLHFIVPHVGKILSILWPFSDGVLLMLVVLLVE